MINEIATVDVLNSAIQKMDANEVYEAKQTLITYRDKLQKEIDEFDKWAETQSDIDTQISLDFEGK